jgi:hypothetical protein
MIERATTKLAVKLSMVVRDTGVQMSEALAELTGGFDSSPDTSITERARQARRELRNSETDWEAVVREHREERDENAGLGRLRP